MRCRFTITHTNFAHSSVWVRTTGILLKKYPEPVHPSEHPPYLCIHTICVLKAGEETTEGQECNRCWSDPDVSQQVEVCWMWEWTVPFNPNTQSPSDFLFSQSMCPDKPKGLLEMSPVSSCSCNTSGEQHRYHEGSNMLVTSTVCTHNISQFVWIIKFILQIFPKGHWAALKFKNEWQVIIILKANWLR